MTFRAKPVVKRSPRPSFENRDRRNFLLNVGFGLVVLAAVAILAIAVAVTYYNDHLVSVAKVDGQAISKDELRDRALVETWRLDEADRRIRTQTVAGRLTQAQADAQAQIVSQQRQQIVAIALERLIDDRIQTKLAPAEGVAVADAEIDARLLKEATTPEVRHAWLIEVAPELTSGAVEPTPAQTAAAKTKADAALRDLQGGKSWEDVARTVSTDTSTAAQAGDLGWLQADDSRADEAYLGAIFKAALNEPTAVIPGADGILRIGRVTEISPEAVDDAYQAKLKNDNVDLVQYRAVVRGDVIRQKLEDKIVADATKPGPQRQVQEILIRAGDPNVPPEGVKVRHILYSPKDDPEAASKGDIPADDPSWMEAATQATAAYEKIKADPSLFDSVARAQSDEMSARGVTGSGGKLPGYVTTDSGLVDEFKTAVLKLGLKDGEVIPPFKSSFGWHVVQIMYHPTDEAHLKKLKADADGGADFGALARDNSEADTAGAGGDLGWVARGQLAEAKITAIFATPVGKTSEVITVPDDGAYLYKVLAEEVRTPEGRQLDEIKQSAFRDWYDKKKASVVIERDPAIASPVS